LIKAITFDFWNTLFKIPDNALVSKERINKFCEALLFGGYEVRVEDAEIAFRECWEHANFCQCAYGQEITTIGHVNFILQRLNLNVNKQIWEQVYNAYITALLKYPPLLNDNVQETLPVLAERYKLAIICNTGATPGSILREFIRDNELQDYFKMMVFSDEVGWAKPNVNIFRHTLEGIKVENSRAAHIGDDSITDVIGAKKAGMQALWLAPHADWAVPECDYHVRSVNELIHLF
jgi:putative hydrolase of the HAD superfamily